MSGNHRLSSEQQRIRSSTNINQARKITTFIQCFLTGKLLILPFSTQRDKMNNTPIAKIGSVMPRFVYEAFVMLNQNLYHYPFHSYLIFIISPTSGVYTRLRCHITTVLPRNRPTSSIHPQSTQKRPAITHRPLPNNTYHTEYVSRPHKQRQCTHRLRGHSTEAPPHGACRKQGRSIRAATSLL